MHPEPAVRRVLIYRLGSLGDTVVALPCFHLLERVFPQAERILLTNFPVHSKAPASAAVLGDSGLVHGYMRYSVGTRHIGKLAALAFQIRRFRPDLLIYLMPARSAKNLRRDRFFFRLAGVRRLVGVPDALGLPYRFDPVTKLYESESSRLARSIRSLGDAHTEDLANWNMRLNPAEMQRPLQLLAPLANKPLIAVAPGAKMQVNDWGRENWRTLLGRLALKYPSHALVLLGAEQDRDLCEYAALDWPALKLNLAGELTPRESAALLASARILIGPDSGPKHLAASVGTPCVCVFSARELPGVWFPPGNGNQIVVHQPECSGCKLEVCIEMERKCIRSITVDEMEQAVERVL